jgi:hypothetical protein
VALEESGNGSEMRASQSESQDARGGNDREGFSCRLPKAVEATSGPDVSNLRVVNDLGR